jgi:predicted HTH transcriptional regulator
VSSFANTIGGSLIFGMTESGGFPAAIVGTNTKDPDRDTQRLEQTFTAGLQPRIRYELA